MSQAPHDLEEFGGVSKLSGTRILDELKDVEKNPEELLLQPEIDEEALDQFDWQGYNERVDPELNTDPAVLAEQEERIARALESGQTALTTVSNLVERFLTVDRLPFSFKGREYLRGLYDPVKQYPRGSRNQIWLAGRQVEKSISTCLLENSRPALTVTDMSNTYQFMGRVLTSTGQYKLIKDIKVGDKVVTYDMNTFTSSHGNVTWRSEEYTKPAYRITTRQGHQVTVGHEHPLFTGQEWVKAEDVKEGDRLAVVGSVDYEMPDVPATQEDLDYAGVMGHLVAEGTLGSSWQFCTGSSILYEDFLDSAERLEHDSCIQKGFHRNAHYAGVRQVLAHKLRHLGLRDARSAGKKVPDWIWSQGLEVRARFLNRLWAGDGHIKQNNKSKYSIEYSTISEKLVKDVQSLLWGFGIPSRIRINIPTLYKGTDKVAFILRVETQRGIVNFLTKIGALTKSDGVEPPTVEENNNRDTLPKVAVTEDIQAVFPEGNSSSPESLYNRGLRRSPKYAMGRSKLREYIDAADVMGLDAGRLRKWTSEEIYWDSVVSVEFIEAEPCQDFTVETEHNYVINGIITHNSTSQAGKSIGLGMLMPAHKCLYVAPRFDQVRVFSQQRFRTMCEDSEKLIGTWIRPSKTLWQVSSRELLNGSFYNFRSCYLSADNARGITAHTLLIDEIQDIVSDAIPVLEQCQSHAEKELRFNAYAGTAKTTGNVITRRYQNSCQFEWLVKCQKCNHWNMSDDHIVGDTCYICTRCGREIFPHQDGRWVPARPELLDVCWGFRISQIMVPFKKHSDIKETRDDPNNTRQKYFNECLGLPYDDGEVVLTEAILRNACTDNPMMTIEEIRALADQGVPIFGGVDYGTGEGVHPAYTVLTIGYRNNSNQFQAAWMRKLFGEEANLAKQPGIINSYFTRAGVRWMGNDWGFGAHSNERIVEEMDWNRFGHHRLMLEYQYVRQRVEAAWNDQARRYMIDRNQSMGKLIDSIRKTNIVFFNREDLQPFVDDFLSIFIEYNDTNGTYKYDHTLPDDAFHSLNYAYLAMRQYYGDLVPTGLPDV